MRLFTVRRDSFCRTLSTIILFIISIGTFAQQKSISAQFPLFNVLKSNCPSKGLFFISSDTLVSSTDQHYIAIIDNNGTPVFFRLLSERANNFNLQPNGFLAYSSSQQKKIFVLDSSYRFIDTITSVGFELNDVDFILTKKNEAIVLGHDDRIFDMSTIVDGGMPNALIKESVLQILDKNKNVIFNWKSSEHFNILDVNEKSPFVDLTSSVIDYMNITDIEVDSDSTLLLCCKSMDEITKINKNTGEIVWRMGGKHNQFTFESDDQKYSQPTSVQKCNNGNLLIFDSGTLCSTQVSSAVEYEINETEKAVKLVRRDAKLKNIYSPKKGGVQGIANGNKLISWGENKPSFSELNPNGTTALEVDFSDNSSCKQIFKSEWSTNLFAPVVDSINFGMWDYTIFKYLLVLKNNSDENILLTSATNFSQAFYVEQSLPIQIAAHGTKYMTVCYFPETIQTSVVNDLLTISCDNDTQRISRQIKLVGYRDDFVAPSLEIYPHNGAVNVKVDTSLYFKFNEPVRMLDNSEITYSNVHDLIKLKKGEQNIEFDAAISSNKDLIMIVPRTNLDYSQIYNIELIANLEDFYNNALLSAKTSLFTTVIPAIVNHNDVLGIKVFPNPTCNYLSILSDLSPISEVEIFNIQGQQIKCYNNLITNYFQIDTKLLSKELYLFRVKLANGKNHTCKIVLK